MGNANDANKTVTFAADPNTDGFPAVVNQAFLKAVNSSKAGGKATQQYFDALNQTSDFWGNLSSGRITFAPGVDPQGHPVYMASDGNVEMRVKVLYADDGTGVGAVVGRGSVATNNTTSEVSLWMALVVRVATMPVYLKITSDLFAKFVTPIYSNTTRVLKNLATRMQQETRVETPNIDALETSDDLLQAESEVVDNVAEEVGAEGVEWMSIEWSAVALDFAGLAPLMALPMIAEMLGHQMTHALIVQNLTTTDFSWSLTQVHGSTAMQPGQPKLPQLKVEAGQGADGADVTLSYQAAFQFINATDYGSIGYVLQLQPADGGQPATLVVAVPWAGENIIWVGTSTDDARVTYDAHVQVADGQLSKSVTFGKYRVTLSLNASSGKTYDSYYYCSTAIIEPIA